MELIQFLPVFLFVCLGGAIELFKLNNSSKYLRPHLVMAGGTPYPKHWIWFNPQSTEPSQSLSILTIS